MLYNVPLSPLKIVLRMGNLELPSNTWFPEHSRSCMAHDRDRRTDRPTDRQTTLLRL